MQKLLHNLSPLQYDEGVIIYEELQEVEFVVFVSHGTIGIGYEMNKK
jgi:hypothetical protein